MKLRNFSLLFLILIIALHSCTKDQQLSTSVDIPPPDIPIPEEVSSVNWAEASTKQGTTLPDNYHHVIEFEDFFRHLIFNAIFEIMMDPNLVTSSDQTVETRSCPSHMVTSIGSIDVLTLDYGTASCSTPSSVLYKGTVTIEIEGDIGAPNTNVNISFSDDFTLNDTLDIDGNVEMTYDPIQPMYMIDTITLASTNTNSNTTTTINSCGGILNGRLSVVDINNNDSTPAGLLDDQFEYEGCAYFHCPNGESLQVISNTPLFYKIDCGIIFDGEVFMFNVDPNGGANTPYGVLNFYYPNSVGNGVCDDEMELTLDGQSPVILTF